MTTKILNFNWAAFDPKGGLKYAFGVAIIIAASLVIEFPWFACGTSALLVWLVNVPGPRSARLKGIAIYIGIGAALIALGYVLAGTFWPWVISMLVVAFIGTFVMIEGPRGFQVGWCLICWFYVLPIFGIESIPWDILSAHLLGSIVMFVILAMPFGEKDAAEDSGEAAAPAERPSVPFVTSYATTVAIVMAIGTALGGLWLKSDPTLILQASLMILMPSALGTWTVAVDRIIGLILGVLAGIVLGQLFGGLGLPFEIIVWLAASFMLVGTMSVNAAPMVFFFVLPFTVIWGTLETEAFHALGNERIVAEIIGVVLAGIAVSIREGLSRKFDKQPA
jgi:hypothetical protein